MTDMKRVSWTGKGKVGRVLHIETEGCIVNIRTGLTDSEGRTVTSVSISPDDETRSADMDGHYWHLAEDATYNNRIIRQPKRED